MIGYSLSFCVMDICEGRVNMADVEKIVASTAVDTEGGWYKLLGDYCETYWSKYPAKARAVVAELRSANKIKQPRLDDAGYFRSNVTGHWSHDNQA